MPPQEPRQKEWRPDLYVVARFLDRLWQPDTAYTRNQLQMATRVNYDLFRRYLSFLEERGFVTLAPDAQGNPIVRLTPAGLAAHRELVSWIERVIGETVL